MSMKKIKLSENAQKVAETRYFLEGEDWEACSRRVANAVAVIEKDRPGYESKFFDIIYNMDFIPGGRILRNSGRPKGSMLNCYVVPIGDSIEEIGQYIKDCLILWSEGGGCGSQFSSLRPKGDAILGKGGVSSGLVSYIEAADAVSKTIESGGQRRAAALACVDVSHPEIIDFINAKIVDGRLSHFNISVMVNDEFLKTVERNGNWTFKFKQKEYGSMPARDIWKLIVTNMIKYAEPGMLNSTNLTKNNSYYYDPVLATNPCVTGETLVAVADGRTSVPIKQLAEEGNDIPVFSMNNISGKVEIRIMRNPRVTGINMKILKITLDDGSVIRCTENHKFIMKNLSTKRADELIIDDRLHHMTKTMGVDKDGNKCYVGINNGIKYDTEHKIIGEFKIGRSYDYSKNEVTHHLDENPQNNDPDNIIVISQSEHDRLHQLGDNNVMRDKWWNSLDEDRKIEYKKNMSISTSGEKNGNWSGFSRDQLKEVSKEFVSKENRHVSLTEWVEFCRENNYPYSSKLIFGGDNGTKQQEFLDEIFDELNIQKLPNYHHINIYKKFLEIKETTDLDVFYDNEIFVRKACEHCSDEFVTPWNNREKCFCSVSCCNKSKKKINEIKLRYRNQYIKNKENIYEVFIYLRNKLNRNPLLFEITDECRSRKISLVLYGKQKPTDEYFGYYKDIVKYVENKELNYKVVRIEEDGFETVYNGTVDANHNFYIRMNDGYNRTGKPTQNYILNPQCGEIPLEAYGVCCLGSLVLPNFVTGSTNTNWKKLEGVIKLAVRFLDNVLDVNKYSLKESDIKAHNSRRIGLGVMGLAEYLFAKEARYGSEKALFEIERLMRFIRDVAYETGVELAEEKGAFPKFDPIQYGNASFVRKLPTELRLKIKEKGIRNVTYLTCPPSGTTSLLPEVSSGIEPLIYRAYKRLDRVSERIYVHPKYKQLLLSGDKVPDWFVDMGNLKASDHFETQKIIQKYIDNAVSKTINLPFGTTYEELDKLLLEYIYDLKGVTVYVEGSKGGQVYTRLSEEETMNYILNSELEIKSDLTEEDKDCGLCEKKEDKK